MAGEKGSNLKIFPEAGCFPQDFAMGHQIDIRIS